MTERLPTLPCRDCGKEILADVALCPHCGRFTADDGEEIKKTQERSGLKLFWRIVGLLALAALLLPLLVAVWRALRGP